MKIFTSIAMIAGLAGSSMLMAATVSINEIHSCLALTKFVDSKISSAGDTYSIEEMTLIHIGLRAYSQYLDRDVVDPKLLKLYGGNAEQASLMKKLFNRQQTNLTRYLDEHYTEGNIPTNYAPAIEECSIKIRTQGDVSLALEKAIDTMKKQ